MCLLVFAWDCHPAYRFVFAGNRDEFHERPARPADWWADGSTLAGRDELAGGTWLGVNRQGRFGVVTNYREPGVRNPEALSRGELVTGYLDAGQSLLRHIDTNRYNGFNLIAGRLDRELHYLSNRGEGGPITPGLHGLSNRRLDTAWPKVRRGIARLERLLDNDVVTPHSLLDLLGDRVQADDAELPDTGLEAGLERLLSSIFIASPDYGTRCSTTVLLDRAGRLQFAERRYDANGETTGESRFEFRLG